MPLATHVVLGGEGVRVIDHLHRWHEEHWHELAARGVGTTLTIGPSDRPNRAARIDLDTDQRLGRLIVWESGDAELESVALPDDIWSFEHLQVRTTEDVEAAVARLVLVVEGRGA